MCYPDHDNDQGARQMNGKHRTLTRTAVFTAVLVLSFFLCWGLWRSGFFQAISSPQEMQAYIQRFAPYSHFIFFLLQLSSVILAPIPSNLTTLAGGLLFGAIPAFFITTAAVILGSAVVFQLARVLGRPFVERFANSVAIEKYGHIIQRKRDVFLLMAFLFPFFPDDLLCIMAGLTDISFRRFLTLVIIGRPWGLLVAAAVGGSAISIPWWGMVLLGVAGLAIFLFILRYGDYFEEKIIRFLDSPKQKEHL